LGLVQPRRGETEAEAFIRVVKRKELAGVPVAAIALIEGLQPYNRSDTTSYFLSVLHDMARDDRHHAIHASFVGLRSIPAKALEGRFRPLRGSTITDFLPLLRPGKRIVAGTKIARFRLSRWGGRYSKVRVEGGVPAFIVFGETKTRLVAPEAFKQINGRLRDLLKAFAEFL
jgi:hypothetical protein